MTATSGSKLRSSIVKPFLYTFWQKSDITVYICICIYSLVFGEQYCSPIFAHRVQVSIPDITGSMPYPQAKIRLGKTPPQQIIYFHSFKLSRLAT